MKVVLFLSSIFFSVFVNGYEKADAFILTAMNGRYKVLSPTDQSKVTSVIIKNDMTTKLIGRLIKGDEKIIKHFAIESGKSESLSFEYNINEKYFFVPLVPSFQNIELKIGEKSYEVPKKREN